MNPYTGCNFWQFCLLFFQRIPFLVTGKASFSTDETQLAVLLLIGICCSLLGAFLLLQKMTMVANSLSHTVLLGIVLCYLILPSKGGFFTGDFFVLVLASFISALLTIGTTHFFTKTLRLQEEASIGLVFTCFFSLAILLVSFFMKNVHLGIEAVMGNVDALHKKDMGQLLVLTGINVLLLFLLQRGLKVCSFDRSFACNLGFSPSLYQRLLLLLLSLTLVGAFRAVGVLLVLAFLVAPYLTIRIWCHRLSRLMLYSCLFSSLIAFLGVGFSRYLLSVHKMAVSTSGLIVVFMALGYVLSLGLYQLKHIKRRTFS